MHLGLSAGHDVTILPVLVSAAGKTAVRSPRYAGDHLDEVDHDAALQFDTQHRAAHWQHIRRQFPALGSTARELTT